MFEEFMAEIFGDEPAAAANTGDRQTITYHHVVDALIITVFAWLSLVRSRVCPLSILPII